MKNFFEHQQEARRRTTYLIFLYAAAVVGTVLLSYLLVWAIFFYAPAATEGAKRGIPVFEPRIFLTVTGVVVLLIGGLTALKTAELASGGRAVAQMLGGREIILPTQDFRERRLMNVVEEMAIASGVPVPPVYVMEGEEGINAFAAGYSPDQAVIGVSRGALEYLNRDELQGVIAHEFSHILNGDMRLNIRLIAIIFGIMGLALFGSILMRSPRSSSRDRGSGQLVLLGLGLYILGIVGAFFGNIIRAMVSRQREFLADASAVQFTRNPGGIGGALKKIGGLKVGASIRNLHAPEAAHMFFADAILSQRLSNLFATHPPLPERIRRIDPNWDGTFPKVQRVVEETASEKSASSESQGRPFGAMPTIPGLPQMPLPAVLAVESSWVHRAGFVSLEQTQHAEALLAAVPRDLLEAAHEPFSARALILALLLDPRADIRQRQLSTLYASADRRDYGETQRLAPIVAELPDAARLPLVDLAIPTLQRMSRPQYETFRGLIEKMVAADDRLDFFEFVLKCALERHLDSAFGRKRARPSPPKPSLESSMAFVVSCVAWVGHEEESAARSAFDAAVSQKLGQSLPMVPRSECRLRDLDHHLSWMAVAPPASRRRLLETCLLCISHDGKTTVREAEIFRAISDVLGVPMPPLVPDA